MAHLKALVFLQVLTLASASQVQMLFLFGDSIFDTGNNNFLPGSLAVANVTPYGTTSFGVPTGRFSDGRLIADFIAEFLGLPYIPPFMQPGASFIHGANFASAGSGLLNATDAPLGVLSLDAQMDQFQYLSTVVRQQNGDYHASIMFRNSLFMITAGSNDIFANLFQAAANRRHFLSTLMSIYRKNLIQLYRNGARRIVVFNLGPLGCTPMVRRILHGSCFNLFNEIAGAFNLALKMLVRELVMRLPGVRISYAKGFNAMTEIMSNASAYGLYDTAHACCGKCGGWLATHDPQGVCDNPSQYLFWDFTHPTEFAYSILAKNFWEGDWNYIEPWNIKTLGQM
ncbi:hypothetical protein SELMODRAFT_429497 [Selaginella moellendorffii]|uniref:Uncharacterized protein n=2 Tax=Selaginella moellendorffii TaxID=88036 RepID=D8T6D4_SELML|nr:hypothetical protein SELMODRAFT_429497 [Selaginella moellendorffii]